jgi:hypothetical protein
VRVKSRGIAHGKATIAYPLPLVAITRGLGALPRPLYEAVAGRARMF